MLKIIRFMFWIPITLLLMIATSITLFVAFKSHPIEPEYPDHEGHDDFVWGKTFNDN